MSYDLDLYTRAGEKCPHCGHRTPYDRVFGIDPTYNIGRLVRAADHMAFANGRAVEGVPVKLGRSFGVLHRMKATESLTWLIGIRGVLADPLRREILAPLQPENGWGSIHTLRQNIDDMIGAAADNPSAYWRICGDADVLDKKDGVDDKTFFGWSDE